MERAEEKGYSIQQWDTRACACRAVHFTRYAVSLSFSRPLVRFFPSLCFPPVLAGGLTSSLSLFLSRTPHPAQNTNVQMHACARVPLYLSLSVSLSLVPDVFASLLLSSFFVLAFPFARSLARSLAHSPARVRAWKRCHPSVERCCHRFVPLLLGEYLQSSS